MGHSISVIIPTWNRKEDLLHCLDLVQRQSVKPKEIIVVDNGSTDGTVDVIKKQFPSVKVIANRQNRGACIARNQGITASAGELLWFLDNDSMVYSKDCLKSMLPLLKGTVGLVGGELLVENNRTKGIIRRTLLLNGEAKPHYLPLPQGLVRHDYLSTANCLVKKSLAKELGGFHPLFGYIGEDTHFSYKARKRGYLCVSTPATSVWHKMSRQSRISGFYRSHRNRLIYVWLEFPWPQVLLLPVLDALSLFAPYKWRRTKETTMEKLLERETVSTSLNKMLYVPLHYVGGLAAAYVWLVGHVPLLLAHRLFPKRFL